MFNCSSFVSGHIHILISLAKSTTDFVELATNRRFVLVLPTIFFDWLSKELTDWLTEEDHILLDKNLSHHFSLSNILYSVSCASSKWWSCHFCWRSVTGYRLNFGTLLLYTENYQLNLLLTEQNYFLTKFRRDSKTYKIFRLSSIWKECNLNRKISSLGETATIREVTIYSPAGRPRNDWMESFSHDGTNTANDCNHQLRFWIFQQTFRRPTYLQLIISKTNKLSQYLD